MTGPEDSMSKEHMYLQEDQQDERITKATFHNSGVGKNNSDENSVSVGEAKGQASEDDARKPESAFDRLHALPEDRQYIMHRFLGEQTYQLTDLLNQSTQGLSSSDDKGGQSMKHSPPQRGQAPLDPNLLMIGAFAEDFDEYEIQAHRKSDSTANSIHSIRTNHQSLEPEALAKEYLAYESCFDKPQGKVNKLENCSNSF